MITDRTLLAYEQFCEEYYDNFDIVGRSYIKNGKVTTPIGHIPLETKRRRGLKVANEAWWHIPDDHPRVKDLPSTHTTVAYYKSDGRRLDKLKMKRDPEYRANRLAEIAERKEKNRARHEAAREKREFNRDVYNLIERLNKTVK